MNVDFVIFGGGVAGLLTAHKLKSQGFSVVIVEKYTLGNGQTFASQGIIHTGAKYSTFQKDIPDAFKGMAESWAEILNSFNIKIHAKNHHMLFQNAFLYHAATLIHNFSAATKFKKIAGYRALALQENVIDIPDLVQKLAKNITHLAAPVYQIVQDHRGAISHVEIQDINETKILKAQQYIFTSGLGNADFLKTTPICKTQTRPLKMVFLKSENLFPLWGHLIGFHKNPLATITTHWNENGEMLWYIGGALAEKGAHQDNYTLLSNTKLLLKKYFKLDTDNADFAILPIDRAEPLTQSKKRPDDVFIKNNHNYHIAWPIKLALAPRLANMISETISIKPKYKIPEDFYDHFKGATISKPLWDTQKWIKFT